jgi:hypothetical protein
MPANDRLYAGVYTVAMKAVIRERVKIDREGTVVVSDSRLHRGDEVEVIVRPARGSKFLQAARSLSIDAPADFSGRGLDFQGPAWRARDPFGTQLKHLRPAQPQLLILSQ